MSGKQKLSQTGNTRRRRINGAILWASASAIAIIVGIVIVGAIKNTPSRRSAGKANLTTVSTTGKVTFTITGTVRRAETVLWGDDRIARHAWKKDATSYYTRLPWTATMTYDPHATSWNLSAILTGKGRITCTVRLVGTQVLSTGATRHVSKVLATDTVTKRGATCMADASTS